MNDLTPEQVEDWLKQFTNSTQEEIDILKDDEVDGMTLMELDTKMLQQMGFTAQRAHYMTREVKNYSTNTVPIRTLNMEPIDTKQVEKAPDSPVKVEEIKVELKRVYSKTQKTDDPKKYVMQHPDLYEILNSVGPDVFWVD